MQILILNQLAMLLIIKMHGEQCYPQLEQILQNLNGMFISVGDVVWVIFNKSFLKMCLQKIVGYAIIIVLNDIFIPEFPTTDT